jgi:hypothetical protein
MAFGLPETLLGDSTIHLFGRVMVDIQLTRGANDAYRLDQGKPPLRRLHPNRLLARQLTSEDATIARIYAFSFQNEFFELVRPALFVVNGEGEFPLRNQDRDNPDDPGRDLDDIWKQRDYGYPAGLTGVAQSGGNVATDLRVWAYDRDDYSLRLDIMTGSFDRILIEHEFAEEGLQGFTRGGGQLGQPGPSRTRRRSRWRSDDD